MTRFILCCTLILLLYPYVFAISITSKYIEVIVDNPTGRFFIKTLKGDPENPNDDNKVILFDKLPPTSYGTVLVDKEAFTIGGTDGYFETHPTTSGNKIIATWRPNKVNKIKVIQIIEIVTNVFTLRDDIVKISYLIVNEDNKDHTVNVSILLDTVLGENDKAPFIVPGYGKIDNETVFYENNMPSLWYSFDKIENPKVKTMGILSDIGGVTMPSKIVFASWRKLDKAIWEYIPEVGASFAEGIFAGRDTGVRIYFKNTLLAPQQLTYFSTMFGLYGDTIKSLENVSLSLSGPNIISSFPFAIVGTIENKEKFDIRNLKVELSGDPVFSISNTITNVEILKQDDILSLSWLVDVSPYILQKIENKEYEFTMKIQGEILSTNIESSVSRKFQFNITNLPSISKESLKELGLKQTEISTNYIGTNYVVLTNYQTVYTTNEYKIFLTNYVDYYPREIDRINSIIENLNRELEELITTYYISKSEEEKKILLEKINLIKEQLEIEKEKMDAILKFKNKSQ